MKLELNKVQKEAAEELTQDVVLMAGAGTGKTQVLTNRFLNILKSGESLNSILAITFTKKAVADMKRKIKDAIIESEDERLKEAQKYFSTVSINTIHGFCSDLISKYPTIVSLDPNFTVLESNEADDLLRDSVKKVLNENLQSTDFLEIMAELKQINVDNISEELILTFNEIRNLGYSIDDLLIKTIHTISYFQDFSFEKLIELLNDYLSELTNAAKFKKFAEQEDYINFLVNPTLDFLPKIEDNLGSSKKNPELLEEIKQEIINLKLGLEKENINVITIFSNLLKKIEIEYKHQKRERNVLDYEDLQQYAVEILKHVKTEYKYVMVDEFQDTNRIQVQILDLLKESNKDINIFVVGDPKQSIYAFRGGSIETYYNYIDKLEKNGAKILELKENYRSEEILIENFNKIFSELMQDKYSALNANIKGNAIINELVVDNEVEYTAQQIEKLINQGVKPGEIAVLYRKKEPMQEMEKELLMRGIKVANTSTKFAKNREIKDVLIVLKLLSHRQDILSFLAFLKIPQVGVSENTVFLVAQEYKMNGKLSKEFIDSLNPSDKKKLEYGLAKFETLHKYKDVLGISELVKKIIKELQFYETAYYFRGNIADKNLKDLIVHAKNFEKKYPQNLDDFIDYIKSLKIEDSASKDSVNLITTHKSKGLEFEYVFIMNSSSSYKSKQKHGLISVGELGIGINRNKRNGLYTLNGISKVKREMEEEIRIFYVACTRAKKSLTFVKKKSEKVIESSYETLLNIADVNELEKLVLEVENKQTVNSSYIYPVTEKNIDMLNEKTLIRDKYYSRHSNQNYYSVSQFMTYSQDRDEYFNQYVLKKKSNVIFSGAHGELDPIIRGNIIHKFAEKSPEDMDSFLIFELKTYGVETNETILSELKLLIEKYKNYDKNILEKEWEFFVKIDEGIVHGFIDQVRNTDDGIEIVDIKTGHISSEKINYYEVQLQVYVYAYEKITGTKVNKAKILSLYDDKEFEIDISKQAIDKTIAEFNLFINEVEKL